MNNAPEWIIRNAPRSFNELSKEDQAKYVELQKEKNRNRARNNYLKDTEAALNRNRINNAKYRERHKEKIKERKRIQAKKLYYSDLENSRKKALEYRNKNREKCRERDRINYAKRKKENPSLCTQKREKLIKANPSIKIRFSLSVRLNNLLKAKGKSKDKSCFVDFIGCSINELKNHIESQFNKKMNWGNWGEVWHVDHIMPCASFDHSIHSQVLQCWHYSNLQPLEVKDNLMKSSKITHPQLSLMLPIS